MAVRAVWKGVMKLGAVTCAVKLAGITTEAERVHFRILNRRTRQPVTSAYVDEETGETVESDDQIKGYQTESGAFIRIEKDEIAALKPATEHTLEIGGFVDAVDVPSVYRDKPYFLYPADGAAAEAFAVIREAMHREKACGLSCIVLYQKEHHVVIEPSESGLVLTTLRNHSWIVQPYEIFADLKVPKVDPEMTEIAELIIARKATTFDPSRFEDRYENALIEMIRAKQEGRKPPKPAPKPRENVVDLASVLRKSLEKEGISTPAAKKQGRRRKAG